MSKVPTFLETMMELSAYKHELLKIYHRFSPNQQNYQQSKIINKLQTKLNLQNQQIEGIIKQQNRKRQVIIKRLQDLQKQKQQMYAINEQLVASNEKLAQKLQSKQLNEGYIQENYEQELKDKDLKIRKLEKEIQNMKLMHAQQLYIMKKKNKA